MSLPRLIITFNALAILCPLTLAILSQRAGTRYWRVTCYPLGVISAVLAILTLTNHVRKTRVTGGESMRDWANSMGLEKIGLMVDTPDTSIALYANSIVCFITDETDG